MMTRFSRFSLLVSKTLHITVNLTDSAQAPSVTEFAIVMHCKQLYHKFVVGHVPLHLLKVLLKSLQRPTCKYSILTCKKTEYKMTIVAGDHRKLYMTSKFSKEIFVRKISEEFVTTKKKGKCLKGNSWLLFFFSLIIIKKVQGKIGISNWNI